MPALYVLKVPEFRPLIACAERDPRLRTTDCGNYVRIDGDPELTIARSATGMGEALWFGSLVGGIEGRISEFDAEVIRLRADDAGVPTGDE
ncbi:MAG TPA: hypothetical protein VMU06_01410 [Stellaceae bacterium]|nr:hypothetical protein [Stellaceae bacterium]